MQGLRKREIPEKTRRPSASSGTIPTCENSVATAPESKAGSPMWERRVVSPLHHRGPLSECDWTSKHGRRCLQATDKDEGLNAFIRYEIVSDANDGSNQFVIHPHSGAIYPSESAFAFKDTNFNVVAKDLDGAEGFLQSDYLAVKSLRCLSPNWDVVSTWSVDSTSGRTVCCWSEKRLAGVQRIQNEEGKDAVEGLVASIKCYAWSKFQAPLPGANPELEAPDCPHSGGPAGRGHRLLAGPDKDLSGMTVKVISSAVIPSSAAATRSWFPLQMFADSSPKSLLRLLAYALDTNNDMPVQFSDVKQKLEDTNLGVKFEVSQLPEVSSGSVVQADMGSNSGLVAAVATLGVLLALTIVAVVVVTYYFFFRSSLHSKALGRKHCSDEALDVRVSVARIAPSLLDLERAGKHTGDTLNSFVKKRVFLTCRNADQLPGRIPPQRAEEGTAITPTTISYELIAATRLQLEYLKVMRISLSSAVFADDPSRFLISSPLRAGWDVKCVPHRDVLPFDMPQRCCCNDTVPGTYPCPEMPVHGNHFGKSGLLQTDRVQQLLKIVSSAFDVCSAAPQHVAEHINEDGRRVLDSFECYTNPGLKFFPGIHRSVVYQCFNVTAKQSDGKRNALSSRGGLARRRYHLTYQQPCTGLSLQVLRERVLPLGEPESRPFADENRTFLAIYQHGCHSTASTLASHKGEPGSIPGQVTPEFSHVGIVPDDAAIRRVFRPPPPASNHSGAAPYPLQSPSSAVMTSLLRAAQISRLTHSLCVLKTDVTPSTPMAGVATACVWPSVRIPTPQLNELPVSAYEEDIMVAYNEQLNKYDQQRRELDQDEEAAPPRKSVAFSPDVAHIDNELGDDVVHL
ncbi:hypothetical protein PR048_032903 [Dryococelus australis]|uniref:Uncharacterized protein n=1 Tax=Dryococelus australis TaxID=614101 RepID=A0ABQ9G6D7_9NEOP|nr:hypothetical protein PR048_032903 [Dryococelus australis]